MPILTKILFSAFLMVSASVAHATLLQVDSSGQLTGATGIDVAGTSYDVTFVDGTCIDLYSGCDEPTDFPFSVDEFIAALQALLDQVFIDGPAGNFDSEPDKTRGCTDSSQCRINVPLAAPDGTFGRAYARNHAESFLDDIAGQSLTPTQDTGNAPGLDSFNVYAVWTAAAAVPAPNSIALLALGLAGLGFSRRQKKMA